MATIEEHKPAADLREFFAAVTPMWIYDARTLAILEVNKSAIRAYGYSRADFLKMTILDLRPREDVRQVMRSALQRQPDTGKIWRHEKRDGTMIHARVTSADINFHGSPARMVSACEVKAGDVAADNGASSPDLATPRVRD